MDTACSASLVASHTGKLYVKYKQFDPMDAAICIGVNLNLQVGGFLATCGASMLSHNGRCFTYDASADGYQRGDGTGCHILKLSNNPEERLAIMAGSQANQDGRSASLTAPNGPSQERAILAAWREASLSASDVDVFEAHGTGTALGDPIEVGAQRKVLSRSNREHPALITTYKTNVGHIEGGAGCAGFIRCLISVMRAACPPNIHLRKLNPHTDAAGWPAHFLTEMMLMKFGAGYMGVSSFGFGGTNCHAMAWGKCISSAWAQTTENDYHQAFMKQIMAKKPKMQMIGNDPEEWTYDNGPDANGKAGDEYSISLSEGAVTWEKVKVDQPSGMESWDITGSFNNWGFMRMDSSTEVDGLYEGEITIGTTGEEEFNFVMDTDESKAFCPPTTRSSKRTSCVVGPQEHTQKKTWLLSGPRGTTFTVELFRSALGTTVTWRKKKM